MDEDGITPEGSYDVACTVAERDGQGRLDQSTLFRLTAGEHNEFG